MASYAEPGQHWTFYEIDPAVERIARDPRYFTFLQDCPAEVEVILGDARLSMANASNHRYDLIVLDAFSSDAIPVHLITREAINLYLTKLAGSGILAFHISNKFLNLKPVLGNLAKDLGLVALVRDMQASETETKAQKHRSIWVVMGRRPVDLGRLAEDDQWKPLTTRPGARIWADDFSDILGVVEWNIRSSSSGQTEASRGR
jgi:spermidine synthase